MKIDVSSFVFMAHCKDKDKEHGDNDSTAKLSHIEFQIKGGRRWKLESVYGIIEGGDKREKARIWALSGDCREKKAQFCLGPLQPSKNPA